jgi:hypothetical protein
VRVVLVLEKVSWTAVPLSVALYQDGHHRSRYPSFSVFVDHFVHCVSFRPKIAVERGHNASRQSLDSNNTSDTDTTLTPSAGVHPPEQSMKSQPTDAT